MPARTSVPGDQINLVQIAAAGVIATLVIAALYFGRPLLVPLALAVLLAFILSPAAEYLRRIGLPRTFSVALTVLVAVIMIGGIGTFVGIQISRLAVDLPQYQSNLAKKIESVRGAAASNSIVEGASALFKNLNSAIVRRPNDLPRNLAVESVSSGQKTQPPIPVEIRQPDLAPFQVIQNVFEPLLAPLATLGIAIIFVVFILLQKEDFRNRFISLAGARDLQRTSLAIDDGAQRLSRYLLLQTAVNACVGLIIGTGLWLCGVPNPALWGLLAAIFRFVPYIGIPVAAAIPLALALAVDSGWTMVALTAALYVSTEAIAGQVVEPWLYGRNMGLSPMAVLISAAFWTWVWGPIGLLLSTPLTMCVVVLGRHVEHLRFLDILLGNRPTLTAEENFYLLMLKGNPDELAEHAETFLKEKALPDYFDEVALKGLALAQLDIDRGALLTDDISDKILRTVGGLIDNLADHRDKGGSPGNVSEDNDAQAELPVSWQEQPVLCVAGRGPLDQAAASLLMNLLARRGIGTRAISPEDASPARVQQIDPKGIRAICLSYLEPGNPTNARFLVRRLRKQIPNVPLVAGFWRLVQGDTDFQGWIDATGCDFVAFNLGTAVEQIAGLFQHAGSAEHPHEVGEEVPRQILPSA